MRPYLTVDGNAYPAVVDGRVKWIVDGYTTSPYFPYSQQEQLSAATADSQTAANRTVALPNSSVNYIRNSVKATVDAYDGSVTLYAWDDQDPVLKAWQKIFPTSLKPYSEMSGALMSHVRYPEDLFKVQRELLGRYHVTNPDSFYTNIDAWSVPNDPTVKDEVKQPPYYMSLKMPDQDKPAFQLTSSFIPQVVNGNARNVLYGFLAADSDAGNQKGVKADSYGQLRLLQIPPETQVPGPGQAQNKFNSDPTVSQALNLLRQGASAVLNGNLLTLPVGGGMAYVQPVYLRSTGETSYPTLQRVLVAFGDKIGFAPTLDEALNQLFGGNSGAAAGDSANKGQTPATPTTPGGATPPPGQHRREGRPEGRPGRGQCRDQGRPGRPREGRLRDLRRAAKEAERGLAEGARGRSEAGNPCGAGGHRRRRRPPRRRRRAANAEQLTRRLMDTVRQAGFALSGGANPACGVDGPDSIPVRPWPAGPGGPGGRSRGRRDAHHVTSIWPQVHRQVELILRRGVEQFGSSLGS